MARPGVLHYLAVTTLHEIASRGGAMGEHAFNSVPQHQRAYEALVDGRAARFYGCSERWNMPGGRVIAPLEGPTNFPAVPHYVLTLHIAGPQVRRLDGGFRAAGKRGTIALQFPGSGGTFGANGSKPVDYAHLYFQHGLVEEVCDGQQVSSRDIFGALGLPVISDIQAYVRRMQDLRDPPPSIEMDGRAFAIAHRLIMAANVVTPQTSGLAIKKIAIIDELIRHAPAADLRLSTLANAAGLSTFHFARQFKAATGESPAAYLMRMRLEIAREMVENSLMSLGEIAAQTGFSSQSHFTNRFRATYGIAPQAYRHRILVPARSSTPKTN